MKKLIDSIQPCPNLSSLPKKYVMRRTSTKVKKIDIVPTNLPIGSNIVLGTMGNREYGYFTLTVEQAQLLIQDLQKFVETKETKE